MAIAVQADSLSSITALAANPPTYPRNPTEEVRKPLVLYIARVPGSKDVFLSTLKPRQKVVTAEDLASSLYYLHVNQPEDISLGETILEEHRKLENSGSVRNEERRKEVSRKPLPSSPSAATDWVPELPPRPNAKSQPVPQSDEDGRVGNDATIAATSSKNVKATKRKPVRREEENARDSYTQMEIRRRPLGPRPENSWPQSTRSRLPGLENQRMQADSVDTSVPPLPPRTGMLANRTPLSGQQASKPSWQQAREFDAAGPTKQSPHVLLSPAARTTSDPDTARRACSESQSSLSGARRFSIILIRRDPSSGAQWNVGKICSSEECESRSSASRYTIQLEITNPGYSKFLGSKKPILAQATYGDDNGIANANSVSEDGIFCRQVSRETMNSWFRTTWKRRSGSSDSKRSSTEDVNSTQRIKDITEAGVSHRSPTSSPRKSPISGNFEFAKLRDKGYTFLSPWDGICEFFTGASGRNLKCKHTIISTTSSGAAQSANVSELRFSLPPLSFSTAFTNPGNVTGNGDHDHEASTTSIQNLRKRLSSQITPVLNLVNDAHRLDLSLGQEKAGGGNRGKKAKLGKLIVEDEGLKMLDLIVAANMGIWWRTYDKMGGSGE